MKQKPTNIITNIREKAAMFLLQQSLKKKLHKPTIYNLSTAKTAGILYDATSNENYLVAKELVKELKSFGVLVVTSVQKA